MTSYIIELLGIFVIKVEIKLQNIEKIQRAREVFYLRVMFGGFELLTCGELAAAVVITRLKTFQVMYF